MKTIFGIGALFVCVSAAQAASPILEMRGTNGPGWLTSDWVVYSDGTVTESHLVTPPSTESAPELVATLSAPEVARIAASIAGVEAGALVQLYPAQRPNPGGFRTTYTLTYSGGKSFEFGRNDSGVEFGLADLRGQDLVRILNGLGELPPTR